MKGTHLYRWAVGRRRALWAGGTPLLLFVAFVIADLVAPLPLERLRPEAATVVTSRDGTPLRVFPDKRWIWRYPVTPKQVSPRYIEALLTYEDRWFYWHPGVNPLAMVRAAYQNATSGRIISGGSTLTMQVARIVDPHDRSVAGKLKQIFRALQLEWHFSKREILEFYLNHAPFGGTVEGVQAASLIYLGKKADRLTRAEAALLAVLPQAPTAYRPDLHPQRARAARDKVLERMADFGLWSAKAVADAEREPVEPYLRPPAMHAPLLSRRLRDALPDTEHIQTTIDWNLQLRLEDYLAGVAGQLPPRASVAVLVVENETLEARAYAGSVDFSNSERFGFVDMVPAVRSPGSTLKPFLYGFALDDGLLHSESLLADVPRSFHGYKPSNFGGGFSGPVSVSAALQRSLNVPAVDVLERFGPENFDARLANGGLSLSYPAGSGPSLAMILGGAGTDLESLVGAYTALGRNGVAGKVRYRPDEPLHERRMMSPGAAWIIREILRTGPRPGLPGAQWLVPPSRSVAWKTGTSYGFRDAWTVGVTGKYTVGVWVGRPDATPIPGQYGARNAAPLMFAVAQMLPRSGSRESSDPPAGVERRDICWPLGTAPETAQPQLCQERRRAWILNGTIPPTLPDRLGTRSLPQQVTYWVNPQTGKRVSADCAVARRQRRVMARWPLAVVPWLPDHWRARARLPGLDPACGRQKNALAEPVRLLGVDDTLKLLPAGAGGEAPRVTFQAVGGASRLYWLVDGELKATTGTPAYFQHRFSSPGQHRVAVLDGAGGFDSVVVEAMENRWRD